MNGRDDGARARGERGWRAGPDLRSRSGRGSTLPGGAAGLGLGLGLGLVLLGALACGTVDNTGGTAQADSGTTSDGTTSLLPGTGAGPGGTGPTPMTSGPMPDDTTAGQAFIMTPDEGGISECDPTVLDDCPRGEKCTAWANDGGTFWNANRCIEIMGEGLAGDSCIIQGSGVSGLDDCALGHICLNTNEMNMGVCVAFCLGDSLECDSGEACAVYNDGVLPLCLPSCDPILQDCPDGQACIDTPNQTFICFSDASGAAGADGDPCPPEHGENSCDPGQWCGPGSFGCRDVNCCTPYCDLATPGGCPAPDECISFFGDPSAAPPGYEDVGVCVLP